MLLHQLVCNFMSKYTQKWFMIIKLRALLVKQQTILIKVYCSTNILNSVPDFPVVVFVTIKSPICGK